jgi:hypothetical protein
MGSVGYDNIEYIIKDNDIIAFYFSQESNGFYILNLSANNIRYCFKHCKRLSENQKDNFINNYYYFINDSNRSLFDINNLIEVLSNEDIKDE